MPKYCELKGECKIDLLSNRHVLIRATLMEDYVHLLSKPVFYIMTRNKSFLMRNLKWDPLFNPVEETSTAIAWISFPALPPNFFGEDAIFSLAAAVDKPLQVDLATKNQSRPSCARVKVEMDLLKEFPRRIKVCVKNGENPVLEKWFRIRYDYLPKYCKTCMIQGHSEDQCYVKHPELYKDKRTKDVDKDAPTSDKGDKDKSLDKEGKKPDEGFAEPKKKNGGKQNHPPHKKDLVQTKNKFASLNEDKSSATKPNYNEGMDIPKPTEK